MNSVFYRAFALLLCCTVVITATAQDKDKPAYGYIPEMKVTLLALDGLLDPRPFLETSFERRTDATHSAELAVGVLLPHSFYDERIHHLFDNRNAGIRLRLNYKIYISQRGEEEQSDHSNSYWAPELMFNYNTLKSTGWYERFDNVYQQQLTYTRRQTAIGWGVKWGQQWFFTRQKKIFLDYFAGVGVRCLIVGRQDTPEDVTLFNGFSAIGFGARGPGTYWHPYLNFGLKLGLVLR